MSGTTTHSIRMAKATLADVEVAYKIAALVEGLHKGHHPAHPGEDAPAWFDEDNQDHLRALYDHLVAATADAGGGLWRVAGGMSSILGSDILDPNDDCLALHPRLQPVVWEAPSAEIDRALKVVDSTEATADELRTAARTLRAEVLHRWEQRTALSFRLQDLRAAMAGAGIDDQSDLYQRLHDVTATAEAWMHPDTLSEATAAHIRRLEGAPTACGEHAPGSPAPGQLWHDEFGNARVIAVADGYAMLRRRRSNPFIASVDQMLRGDYGWDLAGGPDVHAEADVDSHGRVVAVREVPRA